MMHLNVKSCCDLYDLCMKIKEPLSIAISIAIVFEIKITLNLTPFGFH